MKNLYKLIVVMLFALPVLVYSQGARVKTFDDTFSSTAGWGGNMASDFTITVNTVDGMLDVVANKVNSWSVFARYMGNCWSNRLILDQTNRYMEFRVKSAAAVTSPISIYPLWGGNDGCPQSVVTIASKTFTIPEAETWTIVFLEIPTSTGGSQNVIDTLDRWFAMGIPNGTYQFDYIKLGNAAVPPTPTIETVKPKLVQDCALAQNVTLTGISIPGRDFIDGLTISAESLSEGIISDVTILDLGNGELDFDDASKKATAVLSYTPVAGMSGLGDSIIITLKDEIRNKTVKTSFYVSLIECKQDLDEASDDVQVYPSTVEDVVTVTLAEALTGEISVVDMVGNVAASKKVVAATSAEINIASAAPGMYIVKISDGKGVVTKKIVKK